MPSAFFLNKTQSPRRFQGSLIPAFFFVATLEIQWVLVRGERWVAGLH
jgi:hypothetical protein